LTHRRFRRLARQRPQPRDQPEVAEPVQAVKGVHVARVEIDAGLVVWVEGRLHGRVIRVDVSRPDGADRPKRRHGPMRRVDSAATRALARTARPGFQRRSTPPSRPVSGPRGRAPSARGDGRARRTRARPSPARGAAPPGCDVSPAPRRTPTRRRKAAARAGVPMLGRCSSTTTMSDPESCSMAARESSARHGRGGLPAEQPGLVEQGVGESGGADHDEVGDRVPALHHEVDVAHPHPGRGGGWVSSGSAFSLGQRVETRIAEAPDAQLGPAAVAPSKSMSMPTSEYPGPGSVRSRRPATTAWSFAVPSSSEPAMTPLTSTRRKSSSLRGPRPWLSTGRATAPRRSSDRHVSARAAERRITGVDISQPMNGPRRARRSPSAGAVRPERS
jgi:hypothetical protein